VLYVIASEERAWQSLNHTERITEFAMGSFPQLQINF
jgi:hypothetical protein